MEKRKKRGSDSERERERERYVIIYYYLLQVYRSTRRQNPQNHTSTTGHHVPTSNYLLYSADVTTSYMSTCHTSSKLSDSKDYHRSPCYHLATSLLLYYYLLQVHRSTRRQNPQNRTLLLVNMSPPRHISHSLLLPTTGQHVVKPSEPYHHYRSPCHHLAIYLAPYYYLLQVNTSSKPQKLTITTGHHVTT